MPLLADVGDEPADRHEAGQEPEHQVHLLPGEAEHLIAGSFTLANLVSPIWSAITTP